MLTGAVAMIGGSTSCEKQECCEFTDEFGDSYRYCEDDVPEGYSFKEFKGYVYIYGGDCEEEKV